MYKSLVLDRNTWYHITVQTNDFYYHQMKKGNFKRMIAMELRKYSYDYNQIFKNELNFDIK